MSLHAGEMQRKIEGTKITVRKMLYNTTAPDKAEWLFNNLRYRQGLGYSGLSLLALSANRCGRRLRGLSGLVREAVGSLPLKQKRKQEQKIVASASRKKPASAKSRKRTPFTLKRIKGIKRTGVRRRPAKAK